MRLSAETVFSRPSCDGGTISVKTAGLVVGLFGLRYEVAKVVTFTELTR